MSRSSGTGQPISFRCHGCRKRYGYGEYCGESTGTRNFGGLHDVELTGRARISHTGNTYGRSVPFLVEFTCLRCTPIGKPRYSRHVDIARRFLALFVGKPLDRTSERARAAMLRDHRLMKDRPRKSAP